jgi:hypothetical protein
MMESGPNKLLKFFWKGLPLFEAFAQASLESIQILNS